MEVLHEDQRIQQQFDFATLDLKASRFVEAEIKYQKLIEVTNHYAAWCGLGLAKMGVVMYGKNTMSEIEFCFNKAKKINPDSSHQIELIFISNSLQLLKSFYQAYIDNHENITNQYYNLVAGIGVAMIGAIKANNKNSTFIGQLSGLGMFTGGSAIINQAFNSQQNLKSANIRIKEVIQDIYNSTNRIVTSDMTLLNQYNEEFNKIESSFKEELAVKQESEVWYNKGILLTFLLIFFWPIGIYGLYKKGSITKNTAITIATILTILGLVVMILDKIK